MDVDGDVTYEWIVDRYNCIEHHAPSSRSPLLEDRIRLRRRLQEEVEGRRVCGLTLGLLGRERVWRGLRMSQVSGVRGMVPWGCGDVYGMLRMMGGAGRGGWVWVRIGAGRTCESGSEETEAKKENG